MEGWKPVRGYKDLYEVSSAGQVRRIRDGRFSKPSLNDRGYLRYTLSKGHKFNWIYAHRVVFEAFYGAIPKGQQINHKNGIKDDNRLENLEICTQAENNKHAREVLKKKPMSKPSQSLHPLAKFVIDYDACKELGKRVGVDATHILNIREGRKVPSLELAKRLADATGLSMEAFVLREK